jgi:hypothetical protein
MESEDDPAKVPALHGCSSSALDVGGIAITDKLVSRTIDLLGCR